MEVRSPVTLSPVLVGLPPGATFTVKRLELPGWTELRLALPTPVGGVGATTVNEIFVLPARDWASLMVTGKLLAPPEVLGATVAWKEKILSPAVTSPFVP